MNTTLLLNDEAAPARAQLQDVPHGKVTLHQTEAVAGCTCDRWGHPWPGCVERKTQRKVELNTQR